MKRDMDIIRLVLMQQECDEVPQELSKYPEDLVVYNVALMKDAGLIVASILDDEKGSPRGAAIIRLTWAGHDFLDAVRDDNVWRKAKEKVIKPRASWTFSLLMEWLKQEIRTRIPGLEHVA